jgi:hypothetical protein
MLLLGCGDNKPKDILTPNEMVQVMEEIYITEEKINRLALNRDSARQVFSIMKERVFAEAAVSDSVFRRSLDYYMERPRELERIFSALVDTLQLREQRTPYRPGQNDLP